MDWGLGGERVRDVAFPREPDMHLIKEVAHPCPAPWTTTRPNLCTYRGLSPHRALTNEFLDILILTHRTRRQFWY